MIYDQIYAGGRFFCFKKICLWRSIIVVLLFEFGKSSIGCFSVIEFLTKQKDNGNLSSGGSPI